MPESSWNCTHNTKGSSEPVNRSLTRKAKAMKAMEQIGKVLFDRRNELKLTVTRAAKLANINKHQLYAMERGDKDYTMPVFLRYIKVLRLTFGLKGSNVMNTINQKSTGN